MLLTALSVTFIIKQALNMVYLSLFWELEAIFGCEFLK